MNTYQISNVILIAVLSVSVFLLVRQVVCWYFKINERITLQQISINKQDEIIKAIQIGNSYLSVQRVDKIFDNIGGGGTTGDGVNTPEHLLRGRL